MCYLSRKVRLLETSCLMQAFQTLMDSDPRYGDPRRLLAHGAQYWSQNYEDGMIEEIFHRVTSHTKTFLEIGVGDGSENNTAALLRQGWRGWWIDGDSYCCAAIRSRLAEMPNLASRLVMREEVVSPDNIRDLLQEIGVPEDFDLLSLDIDRDTYHIWEALIAFRPKVVIVEYNAAIPSAVSWINPCRQDRIWDGSQAFGASLKAFELLGKQRDYSLVGCDIIGVNAFFVRNDLVGDKFAPPFTSENHYEPPRYGLRFRWAHPSAFYGETHDPKLPC